MQRTLIVARNVVLTAGIVQILLGMLFWLDFAEALVPVHLTVGLVLVLSLWLEAVAAARLGAPRGLTILVALWGLVLPVVGIGQTSVLPGSVHWIVRVVHFALGLGAIGLASVLAARVPSTAAPAPETADQSPS